MPKQDSMQGSCFPNRINLLSCSFRVINVMRARNNEQEEDRA